MLGRQSGDKDRAETRRAVIPSQIAFAGVRIPTLPFPSTAPPPTAANAILHIDLGAVTRDVNVHDARPRRDLRSLCARPSHVPQLAVSPTWPNPTWSQAGITGA